MVEDREKNIFKKFKTNINLSVPRDLFLISDIKPIDILIYELIEILSYREGYCWATTDTIQQSLNIGSNKTVIDSIKKLERLNFLRTEIVKSGGTRRRRIYLISRIMEEKIVKERPRLIEGIDYDWLNED